MSTPFKSGGSISTAFRQSPALTALTKEIRAKADAVALAADGTQDILLSSISDDDDQLLSAMSVTADKNTRSLAAAIVLQWAEAGEHDFDSLEAMLFGAIDEDGDKDLSDEEEDELDELSAAAAQFILDSTSLTAAQVKLLFDDEDDEQAIEAASLLEDLIEKGSTDELIANYAEKQAMLLSSLRKVVRDGVVVKIKKRIGRKRKMSPAQKQALKKARKKSHGAASRAKRKKSSRVRKRNGL